MSQYLIAVHHTGDYPEVAEEEMQARFQAVGRFNQRLRETGAWVFAGGLQPRETATTVDNTGPEPIVTDGPYAETKEQMGGFWVIEAPDLDAALAIAKDASAACQERLEVRPFQEG